MTEKRRPGRPRKEREPHSRYNFILPDRLIYAIKIMATVKGQSLNKEPNNSGILTDMINYYLKKNWKNCMQHAGLRETAKPSKQLLKNVQHRLPRFKVNQESK